MTRLNSGMLSPWQYAQHFRRSEKTLTVGLSSMQMVGANPNRIGLIVSCPIHQISSSGADTAQISGADTSTTGIKLSKNASSSFQRNLITATFQETVGTTVVADLELVRSATTYKLARFTQSGNFSPNMPLALNDTIQWNVTTAVAASTADFTITFQAQSTPNRITLSVNSPAVDGQGICVYEGNNPLVLWKDVVGDMLTEDLYCIASNGGQTIGLWEIFY